VKLKKYLHADSLSGQPLFHIMWTCLFLKAQLVLVRRMDTMGPAVICFFYTRNSSLTYNVATSML